MYEESTKVAFLTTQCRFKLLYKVGLVIICLPFLLPYCSLERHGQKLFSIQMKFPTIKTYDEKTHDQHYPKS